MVSYGVITGHWSTMAGRLNPYCSGRWSRTGNSLHTYVFIHVLILIVVDDGLVPIMKDFKMPAGKES